ncbi:agmatine deiminase family protein [Actinomadura nitritigenes]|uniref:agmatine deiminase family protein n=1 Tax=Actinomadura nitritigenes TaxID=134602 RepID=UPI003D92F87D
MGDEDAVARSGILLYRLPGTSSASRRPQRSMGADASASPWRITAPGRAVVHTQPDPGHPDHQVSQEVTDILRAATDARGERIEVVELLAPTVAEADGELLDYSYLNRYVTNRAVLLGAFDDPRDAEAAAVLQHAHPDREIVQVDARDIFRFGGGIHCITQQQPLQERAWN